MNWPAPDIQTPPMREPVSPREELARYKRALPIVWALIAAGIDSKLAAMAAPGTEEQDGKDSPDWKLVAELTGMKDYVPGMLTQKLVIRLLVDHEAAQERVRKEVAARWFADQVKEAAR